MGGNCTETCVFPPAGLGRSLGSKMVDGWMDGWMMGLALPASDEEKEEAEKNLMYKWLALLVSCTSCFVYGPIIPTHLVRFTEVLCSVTR